MNMSFYNAAVGAQQQQARLNVHANNIANTNTNGFKAQKPTFVSLLYMNVDGINNALLSKGAGAKMEMADTDFGGGALIGTPMSQSYAVQGEGFFGVVDVGTGEVTYTRDGAFGLSQTTRLDENGMPEEVFYLSDGEGRLVLSRFGAPIEVTDTTGTQPVGVFDFVNRDGMRHLGSNRFAPVAKNGQVRLGTGQAVRGVIEASNTDLATEFTKVIEAQRSFSYALKMVQTSDEVENTFNGLRG